MAMTLNAEEHMLRESARSWFAQHTPVSRLRSLRDRNDLIGYDPAIWREMVDLGWAAMPWREEHGGLAFGYRGLGLISEEAGRTLAASPLLSGIWLAGSLIDLAGTDAQRRTLLSALSKGEVAIAAAIEEGAVHDVDTLAMIATRAGDGYHLDGVKTFVIEGGSATHLIVLATTAGRAGGDGLALFVVEAATPGLATTPVRMADSRGMATIRLTDVIVPAEAMLGDALLDRSTLDRALDIARIGLAAEMLGIASECIDRTVAYIQQREQFGRRLATFQSLRHRLADILCHLEMATSVVREALTAIDDARPGIALARLASMAKAEVGEVTKKASREAIQMHGGIGMTDEFDIGFFLKRAAVAEQLLGTIGYHRDRFAAFGGY